MISNDKQNLMAAVRQLRDETQRVRIMCEKIAEKVDGRNGRGADRIAALLHISEKNVGEALHALEKFPVRLEK
jgi:hypothetical protein